MIFQSRHIRVTSEYGTATLWLEFPGEGVNALDLDRLREIDTALRAIDANPAIGVLVIRGGLPFGFCSGIAEEAVASLASESDAAAFAAFAQSVSLRLASMNAVTLAFIDGPCLGAGLELALACDYRLALASPSAPIGFPTPAHCMGGTVRLPWAARELLTNGKLLSAREARSLKLVERAFCERRAKIELRSFLDLLERKPVKPRRTRRRECEGFAEERRAFAKAILARRSRPRAIALPQAWNPLPPRPSTVGLLSTDRAFQHMAGELALHGSRVLVLGRCDAAFQPIAESQRRGFITPLEAEQARGRIVSVEDRQPFHDAELVIVSDIASAAILTEFVRPRCVIAVPNRPGECSRRMPQPRRVLGVYIDRHRGLTLLPTTATDDDTLAAFVHWMQPLRYTLADIENVAPLWHFERPFPAISSRERVAA